MLRLIRLVFMCVRLSSNDTNPRLHYDVHSLASIEGMHSNKIKRSKTIRRTLENIIHVILFAVGIE